MNSNSNSNSPKTRKNSTCRASPEKIGPHPSRTPLDSSRPHSAPAFFSPKIRGVFRCICGRDESCSIIFLVYGHRMRWLCLKEVFNLFNSSSVARIPFFGMNISSVRSQILSLEIIECYLVFGTNLHVCKCKLDYETRCPQLSL